MIVALRRRVAVNQNLIIICGLVAATQMSWGVILPVLPVYAGSFGASPADLGLIVSLFGLGRLVVNIPAGKLAERVDQRRLLLGAVMVVVFFAALTGFAANLGQLYLLRFMTGIAGGVAITVGQSVIATTTTMADRGRAMGTLQGMQLAGGAIGPSFGGVVASVAGVRAAFWCSGVVAVAFIVLGVMRLEVSKPVVPEAGTRRADDGPVRKTWLLGDPSVLAVCVVGFAVFFARFGGQQFLVPLLAYEKVGLSVGQLGLVLGLVTTVNIVLVSVAGRAADRIGRKKIIVPSMTIAGLITVGYIWADSIGPLLVVLCGVGVLNSFSGPTPAAYLADVAPPGRQGTAVGVFRTFGDLAALIGPVMLGWLVEHHGMSSAIIVLAAVSTIAGLWFWCFARETLVPLRSPASAGRKPVCEPVP